MNSSSSSSSRWLLPLSSSVIFSYSKPSPPTNSASSSVRTSHLVVLDLAYYVCEFKYSLPSVHKSLLQLTVIHLHRCAMVDVLVEHVTGVEYCC